MFVNSNKNPTVIPYCLKISITIGQQINAKKINKWPIDRVESHYLNVFEELNSMIFRI